MALRFGGKLSLGKAYLLEGMKRQQMAAEQGTTVDKIKVSGSAPQTVILCLPYIACPVVVMPSHEMRSDKTGRVDMR
jgi:hypothetical protein